MNVAVLAPILLLIAAVTSQFSAAIADIVGASGLLRETVGRSMTVQLGYVVVTGGSLLLIWTLDIFEIITWASRGFAAYYALQTILLLSVIRRDDVLAKRSLLIAGLVLLLLVLLFVVFAAMSSDRLAYVISIAFYVALLVAFLLSALGIKTPEAIRWSATGVLLVLAFVGLSRGLDGYENLEAISVSRFS